MLSTPSPSSTRRYVPVVCVSLAPVNSSPGTATDRKSSSDIDRLNWIAIACFWPPYIWVPVFSPKADILSFRSSPSTLSSTTLSVRPTSPRSTPSSAWSEFTSSSSSSTLLASSSSTLPVSSSPATIPSRPSSPPTPRMTPR